MAPPGLTSDSAKEVRLSADGYRGSGDRLEEARPAEDLVRVVDSEDAPRDEELKEEGEAPLLASVTVASPEEESWEASAPLVLPAGCHEARRSRVPPPLWSRSKSPMDCTFRRSSRFLGRRLLSYLNLSMVATPRSSLGRVTYAPGVDMKIDSHFPFRHFRLASALRRSLVHNKRTKYLRFFIP